MQCGGARGISERICTGAGLTDAERLRDGEKAPSGNFFHIQYVDNLHVFGTDKQQVEQRFWKAVRALRQVGLTVHEIEFDESDMSVLGWSIASNAVLSPTLKRLWRLRLGVRELIRRGSATGQQLERIVGHNHLCLTMSAREPCSIGGGVHLHPEALPATGAAVEKCEARVAAMGWHCTPHLC